MRVIGCDPGTIQSGVCHIDFSTNLVLAKGVLTFPDLRKYIKKHRKEIDLIAIELPVIYNRMQPGTNVTLALVLREVGRLEQLGAQLKIPVSMATRADVLFMVTGRRPSRNNKISKRQCQEALQRHLNHSEPIRPQHASDACACAWAIYVLATPCEAVMSPESPIHEEVA